MNAPAPYGVMFHYFHGKAYPSGQGSIAADQLEAMLRHLRPDRCVGPAEFRTLIEAQSFESYHCLTFDDGLKCQFDIAKPVLDRYGLKAFWFVYSGAVTGEHVRLEAYRQFMNQRFESVDAFYAKFFEYLDQSEYGAEVHEALATFDPSTYLVEFKFYSVGDRRFRFVRDDVLGSAKYFATMDGLIAAAEMTLADLARGLFLDESDLRCLVEEGHVIGLHSYSHPTRLEELPVALQRDEYRRNFSHLQRIVGEAPWSIAHPCNSYSNEGLAYLRGNGITLGFCSNMTAGTPSPLEVQREDQANISRNMALI